MQHSVCHPVALNNQERDPSDQINSKKHPIKQSPKHLKQITVVW
jgi:hypothetical protein